MSWLFSRALVAEYSAVTCSAGAPSAPSNGNHTPQAYCAPDKTTAFSRLSRFGMTCAPLTADRGEALLTSYLAAFHAKTSAPPAKGVASRPAAADCGKKWPESSVKYCRATSSWRTHRFLWDEALPWSSVTLPRWGMTLDGVVLQHPTSERPISATVSGALLRDGEKAGGALNPTWVELLMGWPLGWTDLKPLAMDKFREWQQQHGRCWPNE